MEPSENLMCLFSAPVTKRDDSIIIELPQREVAIGDIDPGSVYRVALLEQTIQPPSADSSRSAVGDRDAQPPPVEEGDVVDVEIEDIGEQGDGIARVGPGYVVIVPETERGDRVSVEITGVRPNMAFAEVIDRYDPRG